MSSTGESEMDLRKIADMTRFASVIILLLHFYYYCYTVFKQWQLSSGITDRLLTNITDTGLFCRPYISKWIALGLLVISLLGATGKKDESLQPKTIITYLSIGLLLFTFSYWILWIDGNMQFIAIVYMLITGTGFLLILSGGTLLSRLIKIRLAKDIFNDLNETFPQEERKVINAYSINLPALYNLKGEIHNSWINIINPFRGLLITGTPGAGKSWFVIQHVIKQHIEKGFCMFIYDFKYDDLTQIAYNW